MIKKICMLALSAALLVSCKQNKEDGNAIKELEVNAGIGVVNQRNYTEAELKIGRRICTALKNKRELFESLQDQAEAFKFSGVYKSCPMVSAQRLTEFTAKISNATTSDIQYISTTARPYDYFKDVITDRTGAMKIVCENLAVSDSVSNYSLIGSSYAVVTFLIQDGYDRFETTKLSKNSSGKYAVASIEKVNVITQANQASTKFFGVEKERTLYLPCSNSAEVFYNTQTWVGPATVF